MCFFFFANTLGLSPRTKTIGFPSLLWRTGLHSGAGVPDEPDGHQNWTSAAHPWKNGGNQKVSTHFWPCSALSRVMNTTEASSSMLTLAVMSYWSYQTKSDCGDTWQWINKPFSACSLNLFVPVKSFLKSVSLGKYACCRLFTAQVDSSSSNMFCFADESLRQIVDCVTMTII